MREAPESSVQQTRAGLGYWMTRVLEECEQAGQRMDVSAVHNLRVALRRCQSMGRGIATIDPDPQWKKMLKSCRRLLRGLSGLRDAQVLIELAQNVGLADGLLRGREQGAREEAWTALQAFDSSQWKGWAELLPARAARLPVPVFELLAVERWNEAYALHRRAARSRSRIAYHRLRIGLKRFRYIVENFLPERHQKWSSDLKAIQDLLGEMHDLDVLWGTAIRPAAGLMADERLRWREVIEQRRQERLGGYRERMSGRSSLWLRWRAELPDEQSLESARVVRLGSWASFLDPEPAHSKHTASLALKLFDGLISSGLSQAALNPRARSILEAAALVHEVGRSKGEKNHHKRTYRLVRKLEPTLGWTKHERTLIALTARYHRGALPRPEHNGYSSLSIGDQRELLFLAGILRLANALDHAHRPEVRQLAIRNDAGAVSLLVKGDVEQDPLASLLASERLLLERALERPLFIRSAGRSRGPL
jgi:CHAD domain-containing protein